MRRFITLVALAVPLVFVTLAWEPAHAVDPPDDDLDLRNGQGIRLRPRDLAAEQYRRLAETTTIQSIQRLEGILSTLPADPDMRAEMMLRLADLYFQQGRRLYLNEIEGSDRVRTECVNRPGCVVDEIMPDHTGSASWHRKSIRLYQRILRDHPRSARADDATYFLGAALKDLGRIHEAASAFKQLVKQHPRSPLAADAYVHLGDYYFDVKQSPFGALRAYRQAAAHTDSPKQHYARYRLAWCYYNVGELAQAIDVMKALATEPIDASDPAATALELQDEALKDLVRFLADAGDAEAAVATLTGLGRHDLIRPMLERLAYLLGERGAFSRSIGLYRRLIVDAPAADDNPVHQAAIIGAYRKMGERASEVAEIRKMAEDYGPTSTWTAAHANDPDALSEVEQALEGLLRRSATQLHTTGRKYRQSRRVADAAQVLSLARDAYELYLARYPRHERAYDVRYGYGELLFSLEDYAGAYDAYMAVVAMDSQGPHSRFCAKSAVFAAEAQLEREGRASVRHAPGGTPPRRTPQALTSSDERFVTACDQFATLFPSDDAVKGVVYKAAYLLYDRFRLEEAAARFRSVIAMDPGSREAEYSAQLILDALVVQENWQALRDLAKAFHDADELGTAAFRRDTWDVYQRASFRVIEATLEADGDAAAAAEAFVAFVDTFPDAPTAAQALHNATVYFRRAGRAADAMAARLILVDDPRFGEKTAYYVDQLALLGFDHEQVADYAKAAAAYERHWRALPDEPPPDQWKRAVDAIYTAAVFRQALGQADAALLDFRQMISAAPSDPRTSEVQLRIGRLLEDQGRFDEAARAFVGFVDRPPAGASPEAEFFARLHAGMAFEQQGRTDDRDALYRSSVARYRDGVAAGSETVTGYVAEMQFVLAMRDHDAYLALAIQGSHDAALHRSVANKARAMAGVQSRLSTVVELGDGQWGLAALVALGEAYENMAHALRTSDRPPYLTPAQRELYDMTIEDRAYLQEQKAVNAFDLALGKAFDLSLYDTNTIYATRRLAELRPQAHPSLSEQLPTTWWTVSLRRANTGYEFTR